MPYRRLFQVLSLVASLAHPMIALADTKPPLDLIELLGEMADYEPLLETALAELEMKKQTQQDNSKKQNPASDSNGTTIVGGSKK